MGPMSSGDGRDPDPGTRARGPGPATWTRGRREEARGREGEGREVIAQLPLTRGSGVLGVLGYLPLKE